MRRSWGLGLRQLVGGFLQERLRKSELFCAWLKAINLPNLRNLLVLRKRMEPDQIQEAYKGSGLFVAFSTSSKSLIEDLYLHTGKTVPAATET